MFDPSPHVDALALLDNKPVVASDVFYAMLPELRARVFTVSGVESANMLQAIRDEVAGLATGTRWPDAQAAIADALEPFLGKEGAAVRSEIVLRANGFQMFSAASHRTALQDLGSTHLQYLHGDCDVPTPEHLALNGVILPKGDPFWADHTGPWGHLGCVCYTRTMSEDQVDDEKVEDEKREPDQKRVFLGPMLTKLNEGDLVRDGRKYNVSLGPDDFRWNPEDLRIPLAALREKYDAATFAEFEELARATLLDNSGASRPERAEGAISLWDWLSGQDLPWIDPNTRTYTKVVQPGEDYLRKPLGYAATSIYPIPPAAIT